MSFITAIERVEIETAFIHSVTIVWTQLQSNFDAYGDFCSLLAPHVSMDFDAIGSPYLLLRICTSQNQKAGNFLTAVVGGLMPVTAKDDSMQCVAVDVEFHNGLRLPRPPHRRPSPDMAATQ